MSSWARRRGKSVAVGSRSLPESGHPVDVENRVGGGECQPLDKRGRCDEAVEWVFVVLRERRERLDVLGLERHQVDVGRQQGCGKHLGEWRW